MKMKATDAKKISDDNQNTYEDWLTDAISKIEDASRKGDYTVFVFMGHGSSHDKDFSNEIREKEKMIRKLGYKTTTHIRSSWESIFYKTFDRYIEIKWD